MNSWVSEEGDKLIKKEDGNYKLPLHFPSFFVKKNSHNVPWDYCQNIVEE